MIQIINKKRYNTETAKKVAEYYRGNRNDFHYIDEELYVTKKGNWFICYEGGAASIYAETTHGHSTGSSGILAINQEEAYEWLERHNEVDAILLYFPNKVEDA